MDATKLAELRAFVTLCKQNPSVLADPKLKFFADYIESLGGKVPLPAREQTPKNDEKDFEMKEEDEMKGVESDDVGGMEAEEMEEEEEEESEIVESEVEIDNEGVVEGDVIDEASQKTGDPSIEVTDEMRDTAQEEKAKAMEAVGNGDFAAAIEHLTTAILNNPSSSILHANRANVFVKLKKPNAAIRDCNEALKLNPDSARAYKYRGEARTLLGHWEEAAKDLRLASKLDYDEETNEFLKKVEPKAHALEEHRRKYDRLRREREERKAEKEKLRRKKAAEAEYRAQKKREEAEKSRRAKGSPFMPGGGMPSGMGFGGMPGMGGGVPGGMGAGFGGGMPGGMGGAPGGSPNIADMLKDPELMAAFQDPAVMTALQDVMKNPSNAMKYASDPKIGPLLMKLMSRGAGGPAGGMGGM